MLAMRHNMRGFSLIELMVGVVIIAILASVGAPNLMNWIQNTQLRTAAETLSSGVQLARAEAVRRNTSVTFTLSDASSGWTVGCTVPSGVDCPPTIQSRSGTEGTSKAVVGPIPASVTFSGLGRTTLPNALIFTVRPTNGTCQANGGPMRCLNVQISQGGQILMCNPAFNRINDPQGC